MASSSNIPELMNLMNPDCSDSVSNIDLIKSPTHIIFFHPYLYEDSSIHCNAIDETQSDHSNALSDYQSLYMPHFSPTRFNADDNPDLHSGEMPHLSPTPSLVDANSGLYYISGTLLENTDLRSSLHRVVWSVYMQPTTFENRWHEIIHRIKQEFSPPSSVLKVPKSEPQTLALDSIMHPILVKNEPEISKQDPHVRTNEDPAFWGEVVSFCDSISGIDRFNTPNPTFLTPSCLLEESPNTLMSLAQHNPWEDPGLKLHPF
ncbi:hypothetical protein L1987_06380 [Smallanthus sonchifolius]|uniref:Uncharacterized protein n=1 Tax=Smallanthus sonchifolius TaxID=185202 RepID=A0ACB9JY06_9ASTR|nr:hypothetical protein L1987_06380 [Smallanthus sonchifolius]